MHLKSSRNRNILIAILLSLIPTLQASAQIYFGDVTSDHPSTSSYYYQNLGQIADSGGTVHPEIYYYTERTNPTIYLSAGKVSFIERKRGDSTNSFQDSSFRIDMKFLCGAFDEICGDVNAYTPSSDRLNYYLPHCSSGITGVTGYAGVEYDEVFPKTDIHFYSNEMGPANYIRFHPGANPNDFKLLFTGQDSITALGPTLRLYSGSRRVIFPMASAYQVDNSGLVTPLNWIPSWSDAGGGVVKVAVGSYDPSQELILKIALPAAKGTSNQNLDWCTFYGASGEEGKPVIYGSGSQLYHATATTSQSFTTVGQSVITQNASTDKDWYVTRFEASGARTWATYFGGVGTDIPNAIIETTGTNDAGTLFVGGSTTSSAIPSGGGSGASFKKNGFGGGTDGLLANFDDGTGTLQFTTFFGGNGDDNITSLSKSADGGTLYYAGNTKSTITNDPNLTGGSSTAPTTANQFPLFQGATTRYYQPVNGGSQDGFLGSFNVSNFSLIWSTFFGSSGYEVINRILDHSTGSGNSHELYIAGSALGTPSSVLTTAQTSAPTNGNFPIVKPFASAYANTSIGPSYEAGIFARFNNANQLDWCTAYNNQNTGETFISDLAFNSSGDLYLAGGEHSDVSAQNIPVIYSGNEYHSSFNNGQSGGNGELDAFIARFDHSTLNPAWSTFYGGASNDGFLAGGGTPFQGAELATHITIDGNDNVYLVSVTTLGNTVTPTGDIPTTPVTSGRYTQTHNASLSSTTPGIGGNTLDGFIVQFKPDNSRVWATHFGDRVDNSTFNSDPNSLDAITGAATVTGSNGSASLFITGFTKCPNNTSTTGNKLYQNPGNGAYYDGNYHLNTDNFIARFTNVSGPNAASVPTVNKKGMNLIVQPNPSHGIFLLTVSKKSEGISQNKLTVTNSIGQVVYEQDVKLGTGATVLKLDLSSEAAGTYFVNISETASEVYSSKIMKID